jgi:hypothetical protein
MIGYVIVLLVFAAAAGGAYYLFRGLGKTVR